MDEGRSLPKIEHCGERRKNTFKVATQVVDAANQYTTRNRNPCSIRIEPLAVVDADFDIRRNGGLQAFAEGRTKVCYCNECVWSVETKRPSNRITFRAFCGGAS